jgi:hypothetical protein
MTVALRNGLLVVTGPAQPVSSARITRTNTTDRFLLSFAKKFFIEEMS